MLEWAASGYWSDSFIRSVSGLFRTVLVQITFMIDKNVVWRHIVTSVSRMDVYTF